ncbi:MAG: HAD family hydrolase [Candidatus Nanopelagicales bacterium]
MIRLVAIDVDGTLLTSDHRITDASAAAIDRARRAGLAVVLASGRPPRSLHPILARLGLCDGSVFLASQGALTGSYDLGALRIHDQQPMSLDLAQRVAAAARIAGLSINWCAGERWLVEALDDRVRHEARIVGCAAEVVDLAAQTVGPDKLLLLGAEGGPDVAGAVEVPLGLVAMASTSTHLEITRVDVDKAHALARLAQGRGIPAAQVAAIGDGRNDLGMLRSAGLAIAPANAHPDVLAAADLVVASNDDDGVAAALDLLLA